MPSPAKSIESTSSMKHVSITQFSLWFYWIRQILHPYSASNVYSQAIAAIKSVTSPNWNGIAVKVHQLDPGIRVAPNHITYVPISSLQIYVNPYSLRDFLIFPSLFFFAVLQEHSNQEMDLEDLIAPSKVSRTSNQSEGASPETESPHTGDGDGRSKNDSLDDSLGRGGRRTRSKRPRSGEEFEQLPERKRELRSSASRLARLAEEKMASKMQSASSNESINEWLWSMQMRNK